MSEAREPLLSVRELSVCAPDGRRLVDRLSFELAPGEALGIVGESGSGKSLTALSLLRIEPAGLELQGSIRLDGQELLGADEPSLRRIRGRRISMVFQDALAALNPVRRIGAQVADGLRVHKGLRGAPLHQAVIEQLVAVGLGPQHARSWPHELSGGQRQRAMLAVALAPGAQILVADEPTSALDVTVQKQVLALLQDLRVRKQLALVFISHDLAVVSELCDRVLVMRGGHCVEQGPVDRILQAPESDYARALLACRPRLHGNPERLASLDGTPAPAAPAPAVADEILIEARELRLDFVTERGFLGWGRRSLRALDGVSLSIRRGETLGLVGESGSGKTTLGRVLLRLTESDSGEIDFLGNRLDRLGQRELRPLRRRMQMIFQDPYASLNPRMRILDALTEPMLVHGIGVNQEDRIERAAALLAQVGLEREHLWRLPHAFSGGQRQRIVIARALSVEPEFIVCDECVSALDVSVQAQVLNLLKDLQAQRHLTYLFISHDLSVVNFMAHRVAVMQGGRILECADVDTLWTAPGHAYTRELLEAVPGERWRPSGSV